MTTAAPRPRALLFDWDNTLVDTWETIHEALRVTFTAMGREPWTLQETKLRVAKSLRDSFPALFGERWEEARRRYLDAFVAMHLERLKAIEGAGEMLAELARAGLYLAVVSNKTGAVLRAEAEHLGWTGHFKRLVGAGDAALDKPHAAPMLLALEGSGIACAEAWYVGDTALDVECARNAGCVAVLLGARALEEDTFARFPPDLLFRDYAGLRRHIRGL
ncbi:MAG TPA: HAD family hydrolase [Stellaceae bacterium]|nr:HAD family hydrolase [Stellaceae bacterium]